MNEKAEKHTRFMREALKEAQRAFELDEVPVGAVVVCQGRVIARGHNLTERLGDPTAHAEMQAFTAATNFLGGKYLDQCTLYVTVEPCPMCAGGGYGRNWAGSSSERATRSVGSYGFQRNSFTRKRCSLVECWKMNAPN